MSWHVSPCVYPVWDSLCFLDLIDYFLSHVREVFDYNLFKCFLRPFLFFFWDPYNRMLVCLMLSQKSLRLSSILFILYSLFCLVAVISTILSSNSLIRSSASVILLLIPSSVFLISVIVLFITVYLFFSSSRSLLNISCIFSILFLRFWIIFTIITLTFFGRLPISSSFILSCGFLPYCFVCNIFLCLLILSDLLWSPF